MQTEIQNLIDHPETIREALNLKQLDRLIQGCFCVHGLTLQMQYSVSLGGRFNEPRFNAENADDVTACAGIFSSVLRKCQIGTFKHVRKIIEKNIIDALMANKILESLICSNWTSGNLHFPDCCTRTH